MSSGVFRFIVKMTLTVFVDVIPEQLYVNWTEQKTQMRKTGYTWSHLSYQLCAYGLCLSHKPLLVSAYHPSEPSGCFGSLREFVTETEVTSNLTVTKNIL